MFQVKRDPSGRAVTTHGHLMSPRMERLWVFIREEREIDLCDWSTDECVERAQAQLRAGEVELVERIAKDPDNPGLTCLLVDYRAIMNRRPHGRLDQAQLRASEKKALAARAAMHGGDASDNDEIAKKIRGGRW